MAASDGTNSLQINDYLQSQPLKKADLHHEFGFIEKSRHSENRPFSHCLCACVYRSRGALFLDNRRDFTEMGQTDFKPLILSM